MLLEEYLWERSYLKLKSPNSAEKGLIPSADGWAESEGLSVIQFISLSWPIIRDFKLNLSKI